MNRFPLDRRQPRHGAFGLGDLLIDAAQRAAAAVGPKLVVHHLVSAAAGGAGGPGLGEELPVVDLGIGVLCAPLRHDVRHVGDPDGARILLAALAGRLAADSDPPGRGDAMIDATGPTDTKRHVLGISGGKDSSALAIYMFHQARRPDPGRSHTKSNSAPKARLSPSPARQPSRR
jgi:hypothetical protein